jgi:hypothetical protein
MRQLGVVAAVALLAPPARRTMTARAPARHRPLTKRGRPRANNPLPEVRNSLAEDIATDPVDPDDPTSDTKPSRVRLAKIGWVESDRAFQEQHPSPTSSPGG